VEDIIDARLPDSAHDHRQWWANQDYGSRAYHWENAGFKVDKVDQRRGVVTFRRARTDHGARGRERGSPADRELEAALREINARAGTELNERSGRFTQRLDKRGGIGAADKSLHPAKAGAGGLSRIIELGRPDL